MTDEELERLKLRAGLHIAMPGPDVRALIEEVERLRGELRAVHVLDAWAKKNDRQVPGVYYVGDTWHVTGATFEPVPWANSPAEARSAAAKELLEGDPELGR